MDEPDHLKGLMEGLGRIFRHHPAIGSDGKQFGFAFFILANGSLPFGLVGHAVGVGNQALALDNACLPEIDFLLIISAGGDGFVDISLTLLHIALQTYSEQFLMVTGSLAGHAVGQTHRNDVILASL